MMKRTISTGLGVLTPSEWKDIVSAVEVGVAVKLVKEEECGLWYLYNPEATPRFSSPE